MSCQRSVAQALVSIMGRQTGVEAWRCTCRRSSLPAAACRSLPQLHLRPLRPAHPAPTSCPTHPAVPPSCPSLDFLGQRGAVGQLGLGPRLLGRPPPAQDTRDSGWSDEHFNAQLRVAGWSVWLKKLLRRLLRRSLQNCNRKNTHELGPQLSR